MGSRPPARCPICHDDLDPSEDLDDHLIEKHSKEQMAKSISAEQDTKEEGDISE